MEAIEVPGAITLGDHHCGPRRDPHEQVDKQVDDDTGGAAYSGQRLFAHILAHHHGVHRVVELLKKSPQQDGKEEQQELFPNHALGDPVLGLLALRHPRTPSFLSNSEKRTLNLPFGKESPASRGTDTEYRPIIHLALQKKKGGGLENFPPRSLLFLSALA